MKRYLLILALFLPGTLWASCPTGANYRNPSDPTGAQVTLASLGITTCYYAAATGSDTNSGTSESSPFLHAPGMPNFTGSATIGPGVGIILRGGDTWHFGASTSPASGGTWSIGNNGSSGSPIFMGTDPTWYAGSSWARPILTGDNPVCNAGTLGSNCHSYSGGYWQQFYVNSCAHNIGSSNDFIAIDGLKYIIIDNFEMTGLCQSANGQPSHTDNYFSYGSLQGPIWIMDVYAHGWSHLTFGGPNGSDSCTSSNVCQNIYFLDGGSVVGPPGDSALFNVIDASDSDPVAMGLCQPGTGLYQLGWNVISGTSQCVSSSMHSVHDNLYINFYENGHSNVLESNNTSDQCPLSAVYNNLFYNIESSGGTGGVFLWPSPPTGCTDAFFNNVSYNIGNLEVFNIGTSGVPQGTLDVFNNTWQTPVNQAILRCTYLNGTLNEVNNHYIDDAGSYFIGSCPGTITTTAPLLQTNAVANADGYTSSTNPVYAPQSSSAPTVGHGANATSYCSALQSSSDALMQAAGTACTSDAAYGVSYDTSNHTAVYPARTTTARPSSGAWDIGAYEFSGTPTSYSITVSSITGNGTVTSSQGGISCTTGTTGTCSASGLTGTTTMTFTAASGYTLTSVTGCTLSGTTCPVSSSATITATFTANSSAAAPTFSPVAGNYYISTSVSLSSATSGATICYTTDGSTPTANGAGTCTHGTTYSTAISVTSAETIKAVASKSGFTDSTVSSAAYTITPAIAITTTSPLPNGTVGIPYSYTMAATGGYPPYTWTDPSCSGACNTGLYFFVSGDWSGTPANAGTSTFTIQVTDNNGNSTSGPFSLTINPAVSAQPSSPVMILVMP